MIPTHTVTKTYSAPTSNVDLSADSVLSGTAGLYYTNEVFVNSGVSITGTGSSKAFTTGPAPAWHGAAIIKLNNRGTIQGFTGSTGSSGTSGAPGSGSPGGTSVGINGSGGSPGGPGTPGGPGGVGGPCLEATRPILLNNGSGSIIGGPGGSGGVGGTGGAGGGGGGGAGQTPSPKGGFITDNGGRGGDGLTNSGLNTGKGTLGGSGGSGGGAGSPGSPGAPGSASVNGTGGGGGSVGPTGPTGPSGTRGNAIEGNSNITTLVAGTITGPIT